MEPFSSFQQFKLLNSGVSMPMPMGVAIVFPIEAIRCTVSPAGGAMPIDDAEGIIVFSGCNILDVGFH
jgi:hypothetical protein